MIDIKERIKEALQIRGMSAAELSRKSGIDKGSISNYLKGKYLPKQSAIGAMAIALHVSPAWLMGYDVEMESNIIPTDSIDLDLSRLTPENLERIRAYYQALIDTQGDKV